MATNISLSSSMRSNLLALQNTAILQDMTQDRLATGKKVNSAIDNPTSYFTAQSLNNRASDLSGRLDGIGQALQTLKAADKTLNTLTTLVGQAKALATQAAESVSGATALTTVEARTVTTMADFATSAAASISLNAAGVNTTAGQDAFYVIVDDGTARTISGVTSAMTMTALAAAIDTALAADGVDVQAGADGDIQFLAKEGTTIQINEGTGNAGTTIFGGTKIGAANVTTVAAPASSTLMTNAFAGLAAGDKIDFSIFNAAGTTAAVTSIDITAADTIASFVTKMDTAFNAAGTGSFDATYNTTTNKIDWAATAGFKVQINENTNTPAAEIFGSTKVGSTNATTFGSAASSATVSKNLLDFKEVMSQLDAAIADASYKGKNLLKGEETLTVLFNEDGSSKLEVAGVNFAHDDGLGFGNKDALVWSTTADIQTSIDAAKTALDNIRSQAQKFGTSNSIITAREDFTKSMVEVLKSGADKLVLADMNEEAANMLALQTQRQLATNSLTMASQAAQGVLQLFR